MDALGDRMKAYEAAETGRRFMPLLPLYARIDGRNFTRFTKGLERPFDERFHSWMVETTRQLVQETGAVVGYTQSDEINLLWYRDDPKSQLYFDGKIFKVVSATAAMASGWFGRLSAEKISAQPPTFDCRAFQLPTLVEATNAILWRELDATKNAISMAARAHFSHKQLMHKNSAEMQEMLWAGAGVNFNDYPSAFKRGSFVLKRTRLKELDAETLTKIPLDKRPDGPIERQVVERVEMPPLLKVVNRVAVLFEGAEPETEQLQSDAA